MPSLDVFMKLATLAALTVVFAVGRVSAGQPDDGDVDNPSGNPQTVSGPPLSGPPFGSLPFLTTAVPSTIVSRPSSYISSLSTSITPYKSSAVTFPGASGSVSTPTTTGPSGTTATSAVATSTGNSGARGLGIPRSGIVGLSILGAIAALVC